MFKLLKKFLSVGVIFSLLITSNNVLASNKKIGIILFDGVLTSDVTGPLEVFGAATKHSWFTDYDVVTIGVEKKSSIKTEEGLMLSVDSWIGDSIELDMLIVPSSYTMTPLLENQQLIKFIKTVDAKTTITSSNCSGALLLAKSGVLDGKKATTWAGGESDFQKQFPKVDVVEDQNVTIDGKYITSNGSVVSYESAIIALSKLSSVDSAKTVFEALQMGRITSWDRVKSLL